MLSRVADAIYWMNRYVERAENVARFVDTSLHLALDVPELSGHWALLVEATGDEALFRDKHPAANGEDFDRDEVIRFLTFDRDNPNSVISCLAKARENARGVREVISSELWVQVNNAYLMITAPGRAESTLAAPHELLTAVKNASHLFVGTMDLTMTHNEGWHFGRLGRLLERADKTSRILDSKSAALGRERVAATSAQAELEWAALLRSVSAFEMYRKRFGVVEPKRTIEFLLLEGRFPRSVLYCLKKAQSSLRAVSGSPLDTWTTPAERELGLLVAELAYTQIDDVVSDAVGPASGDALHRLLEDLERRLAHLNDSISRTFFSLDLPHEPERESVSPPSLRR